MILAIQIGLDTYLAARRRAANWRPMVERPAAIVPATA